MNKKTNRWIILISCIIINLCLGAGYAWSVFQGPLMEQFGWSTSQASLAFSISFGVDPIAMIIFGPKQDRSGPRMITFLGGILFGVGMILTSFVKNLPMLYLSYGVVLGFGIGTAYGCTTAVAVKWFPDKKGLAGGLTAAGFGSGALVFAPIAVKLIEKVGVLFTFRYLGIALLIIICGCALTLSAPPKTEETSGGTEDKKPKEMLQTSTFWLLWVAYVFGCISGLMIIGHASPIAAEHLHFDLAIATMIVSIVSLGNTFGRLFWGTVSDKIGRYNSVALMFITSCIGLLLLNFKFTSIIGVVGIVLIALCFGGFLGIFPGITADNWGAKFNGSNYGIMSTAFGLASIVGPSIVSFVKESSGGEYGTAFIISIILNLIGIALILLLKKREKSVSNS